MVQSPSRDTMLSVCVILPALNERQTIADCLRSLIRQDYPRLDEIIVADGGSTDGTQDLVRHFDGQVTLIDNQGVTAAAGLNAGLRVATADVVCRADAHALYAPDYVRSCVRALLTTGAANVGGPMVPIGTTSFGRAVAAVTSSALGVGPGRFHYSSRVEDVDTVYLGCWRRTTLLDLDGFDDTVIQWGGEDQDLNLRIRQRGGRVVLDPSIRSTYFPRETPRALARQYANYGVIKASTLAKHRSLPSWRPLVPATLVGLSAVLGATSKGRRRAALPALHAAACGLVAINVGRQEGVAPHRAFLALEICHWSYGAGFWRGLLTFLSGRPFETRPRGHR